MKRLFGLVGFFSTALFGCGGKSSLWKQSDFPLGASYAFVVKVVDPVEAESCSGVMLSPTTVLTAAHCLKRQGNFVIVSYSGTTVAKEVAHLGDGTTDDTADLALLSTQESVWASRYPQLGEKLREGEPIRVAGFGCRDDGGSGTMETGTNSIGELGKFAYLFTELSGARGLVGGVANRGLCAGDSGAPVWRTGADESLVGLGHAIAHHNGALVSFLIDLTQGRQREFLRRSNEEFELGIGFAPTHP